MFKNLFYIFLFRHKETDIFLLQNACFSISGKHFKAGSLTDKETDREEKRDLNGQKNRKIDNDNRHTDDKESKH